RGVVAAAGLGEGPDGATEDERPEADQRATGVAPGQREAADPRRRRSRAAGTDDLADPGRARMRRRGVTNGGRRGPGFVEHEAVVVREVDPPDQIGRTAW